MKCDLTKLSYITVDNSRRKLYHVLYPDKYLGQVSLCKTTGVEAPLGKTTEHSVKLYNEPPEGFMMCGQCLNIAYSHGLLDITMKPKRNLVLTKDNRFVERPMTIGEYKDARNQR